MEPVSLFPDEVLSPRPLFDDAPAKPSLPPSTAAADGVAPLFLDEGGTETPPAPRFDPAGPLFSPALPAAKRTPSPTPTESEPRFSAASPSVQASVPFQEDIDPLAEKTWAALVQQFPSATDSTRVHWRAKLRTLFPLTAESLNSVGQTATERMPMVMAEVSRLGEALSVLEPAKVLNRITEQARAAHQASGGLRARMEALLHTFRPEDADRTLTQLQAQLVALQSRIGPVRDLVGDLMTALDDDLPLVSALASLAQASALGALATRRQEMLQALHQQLAMAKMQLEQLSKQIAESLQSLDELRTVTLPALGFLQSLR